MFAETVDSYKPKQVAKKMENSLVSYSKNVLTNFEDIQMTDVSDQPRQDIIAKKDFPRESLALILRAQHVDFKRDAEKITLSW